MTRSDSRDDRAKGRVKSNSPRSVTARMSSGDALLRIGHGRRGDTISPVVMWIGVILAVLIAATWFLLNVKPVTHATQTAQRDLADIRIAVEKACTSSQYDRRYNPVVEEGQLFLSGAQVCINTTTALRCAALPCAVSAPTEINLTGITYIHIRMNAGILTILPEGQP